jgi:hypothetical protein
VYTVEASKLNGPAQLTTMKMLEDELKVWFGNSRNRGVGDRKGVGHNDHSTTEVTPERLEEPTV